MGTKLELLAPAGGIDELKAAVQSGADAVYMGATMFSARAGAKNFTADEMREAVSYAHAYGVAVHCTINTLIKENELDTAIASAVTAYECGVDALIIQDLGLALHLREIMPDMELHASTQMTVTSLEGVRYLEKLGFSRVVLARELSFSEIERIVRGAKAEIEVFVHGAICMSYSGQCLMSSLLGGRSGNRGRCAQPCRLSYELLENGKAAGNGYLLSPRDMALIGHIAKLKEIGVSSLKIEGRLKSKEYVSTVVGIYRDYIDNTRTVSKADMGELRDAFSRSGFTDGYFTGVLGKDMMSHTNPANNSGSTFTEAAIARASGEITRRIAVSMYASLKRNDVIHLTVLDGDGNCVTVSGEIKAETAKNRPLTRDRIEEQLKKLGSTIFEAEDINIEADEGITVPLKEINEVRRRACEQLFEMRGKKDRPSVNISPLKRESYKKGGDVLEISVEVRTLEQALALKGLDISRIYAPTGVAEKITGDFLEVVTKPSDIFLDNEICKGTVIANNTAILERYGDCVKYGDFRLNVFNSLTANAYSKLDMITLSPELNLHEIKDITSHTRVKTEIIAYGRLPLMIMKNCPIRALKRCQKKRDIYYLRDRKNIEFPVVCMSGCRAVILNSKPLYTADMTDSLRNAGINSIRLMFTIEKPSECRRIFDEYSRALMGEEIDRRAENSFTRGHLHRGVL